MTDGSTCKVDVVTESYGLEPPGGRHDGLDEYLVARWLGTDGRAAVGYRTLADEFNRHLLRRVYERHGRDVLDARLESDYETLTAEENLQRAELVEYLAGVGIDAEAVCRDMVSWGSIATHLKECLGAEKERPADSGDWERRSIDIATDRAAEKAEEALGGLASEGGISEDVDVTVQVNLACPECRTRVPLDVALGRGYVCDTHD
jgi:hypothetical protein